MRGRVNGLERSRGNFKDIYWSFGDILARASESVTLLPGDVIGSGTVGTGCLLELPKPRAVAQERRRRGVGDRTDWNFAKQGWELIMVEDRPVITIHPKGTHLTKQQLPNLKAFPRILPVDEIMHASCGHSAGRQGHTSLPQWL